MKTTLHLLLALVALVALGCETSDDAADPDAQVSPTDTATGNDLAEEDVYVPLGEPEWRLVDVGQGATTEFAGIHGATYDGGYVVALVGSDASVFVYDSATEVWDPRPAGEARVLNAVWVEGPDTVYVGGDSGILRRWDASAGATGDWVDEGIPDLGDLAEDVEILDMWGDRETGQFICGTSGFIGRWDDSTDRWRPEFFPGAEATQSRKLEAIWGGGPDDVWAVGNRIMAHWNGTEWDVTSFEEENEYFHGVWTSEQGVVYAVADQGRIWTLDRPSGATEWTNQAPVRMTQLDTWGLSSAQQVFSVGWNSTMLRLTNGAWDYETLQAKPGTSTADQIPSNLNLAGLWGTTGDNLYVIADEGYVIRWGALPVGQ